MLFLRDTPRFGGKREPTGARAGEKTTGPSVPFQRLQDTAAPPCFFWVFRSSVAMVSRCLPFSGPSLCRRWQPTLGVVVACRSIGLERAVEKKSARRTKSVPRKKAVGTLAVAIFGPDGARPNARPSVYLFFFSSERDERSLYRAKGKKKERDPPTVRHFAASVTRWTEREPGGVATASQVNEKRKKKKEEKRWKKKREREAMDLDARATDLHDLPNELWAMIARRAGGVMRPILAMTSHRWRGVLDGTHSPNHRCDLRCMMPEQRRENMHRYALCLVRANHLALLGWACAACALDIDKWATYKEAARCGHLSILQWLSRWHPLVVVGDDNDDNDEDDDVAAEAAEAGHLDIVKWLHEHRHAAGAWSHQHVARIGDLDMVRWLCAQGIPEIDALFDGAARGGHLHVIEWLHEHAPDHRHYESACTYAAAGGHLGVLQWLRAQGWPWNKRVCIEAAESGHLAIIEWATAHGCSVGTKACAAAAKGGHVHVLQWLHDHGCAWGVSATSDAARYGGLETLKWLIAQGCPYDADLIRVGAHHTGTVQWVYQQLGCPLTPGLCFAAAQCGNLDLLVWLRASGCPWDASAFAGAAYANRVDILDWLHKHDCPWSGNAYCAAARDGNIEAVDWFHAHGYPSTDEVFESAVEAGHLGLVQWLHHRGFGWCRRMCLQVAHGHGCDSVAEWIESLPEPEPAPFYDYSLYKSYDSY